MLNPVHSPATVYSVAGPSFSSQSLCHLPLLLLHCVGFHSISMPNAFLIPIPSSIGCFADLRGLNLTHSLRPSISNIIGQIPTTSHAVPLTECTRKLLGLSRSANRSTNAGPATEQVARGRKTLHIPFPLWSLSYTPISGTLGRRYLRFRSFLCLPSFLFPKLLPLFYWHRPARNYPKPREFSLLSCLRSPSGFPSDYPSLPRCSFSSRSPVAPPSPCQRPVGATLTVSFCSPSTSAGVSDRPSPSLMSRIT